MIRAALLLAILTLAGHGREGLIHAGDASLAGAWYDRKIDEYGDIRFDDEKARLDNVAIELQNDPRARLHLICYGGRVGREAEAVRRCRRAANYVSVHRGFEASRIVTLDGGYREDLTVEVWIIPPGMTPPPPSPTVDPGEVRFVKGKVKRRAGRH